MRTQKRNWLTTSGPPHVSTSGQLSYTPGHPKSTSGQLQVHLKSTSGHPTYTSGKLRSTSGIRFRSLQLHSRSTPSPPQVHLWSPQVHLRSLEVPLRSAPQVHLWSLQVHLRYPQIHFESTSGPPHLHFRSPQIHLNPPSGQHLRSPRVNLRSFRTLSSSTTSRRSFKEL